MLLCSDKRDSKRGEEERHGQKVEDGEGRRQCSDSNDAEKLQPFLVKKANRVVRDEYCEVMSLVHLHADEQKSRIQTPTNC